MAKDRSLSKKTLRGKGEKVPGAYKLGSEVTPNESFSHPSNNLDLDTFIRNVVADSNGNFNDGTASDPSISFKNDDDTGFYRIGSDNLGLALNGTKQVDVSTSVLDLSAVNLQLQSSGKILDDNGNDILEFAENASAVNELSIANASTGSNPALGVVGSDTDITLALSAKGTGDVLIQNSELTVDGDLKLVDGSSSDPSLTFISDQDTGLFRPGSDSIGFAVDGTKKLELYTSVLDLATVDLQVKSSGKVIDDNGNNILQFSENGFAVNEVGVFNAATGNNPGISATGNDNNINLFLLPKGTGDVDVGNTLKLQGDSTDLIYTEDSVTNFVKADSSGDGGLTVSNDGMTADPETGTEDGYITVDIGGSSYQIPIYSA